MIEYEDPWTECPRHHVMFLKEFQCALCQLEQEEAEASLTDEELQDDRLENRGEDEPAAA